MLMHHFHCLQNCPVFLLLEKKVQSLFRDILCSVFLLFVLRLNNNLIPFRHAQTIMCILHSSVTNMLMVSKPQRAPVYHRIHECNFLFIIYRNPIPTPLFWYYLVSFIKYDSLCYTVVIGRGMYFLFLFDKC